MERMKIKTGTIVETLRAHRAELEAMGVKHMALFGSQAKGTATPASDIDIGVEFDDAVRKPAMRYFGVRQRVTDHLSRLLGAPVDLSDEEMQKPLVRENYQAERFYAF